MEEWGKTHSGEVLCVVSNQADEIASCGDDGVVLWSADGQVIGRAAESCPSPVSSVCYGSDSHLYCAEGRCLHAYDTRDLTVPLWSMQLGGSDDDELNQVAVSEKGTHVAVCDDNGDTHVADARTGKLHRTLRRQHNNVCTSVQFRPRRASELATCGLDCKLLRWDYSCGRPLQREVLSNLEGNGEQTLGSATPSVRSQLLNPPFLHQLSFHRSGSVLAAAAEDGAVRLYSGQGKDELRLARIYDGVHPSSACLVQFSRFAPDSVLVSAGNDRRLVAWQVAEVVSQATAPRARATGKAQAQRRGTRTSASKAAAAATLPTSVRAEEEQCSDGGTNGDTASVAHHVVAVHSSKINWLTTCASGKIVIADQTSSLKAYSTQH